MEEEAGDMMDMARCLVRLADPQTPATTRHHKVEQKYECKTCKKSFRSPQALGGHRTSHKHKKPRTGYQNQNGSTSTSTDTSANPKVHSCSVCGSVFVSGQALGGHMRKHRQLVAAADAVANTKTMPFDLNLPCVEEGDNY